MISQSIFSVRLSAASTLRCNIGVADITPESAVALAGFAARVGLSTDIHRHLKTHYPVIYDNKNEMPSVLKDVVKKVLK